MEKTRKLQKELRKLQSELNTQDNGCDVYMIKGAIKGFDRQVKQIKALQRKIKNMED